MSVTSPFHPELASDTGAEPDVAGEPEGSPAFRPGSPASAVVVPCLPPASPVLFDDAASLAEGDVIGTEYVERSSLDSLIRNFTALLADVDYREALTILGVGTFQFSQRRRLKREFQALYIGLWRLALKRSLPEDYNTVFHAYMEQQLELAKKHRDAAAPADLVLQYVDQLREHGDSDFSDVSRHLLSLLEFDESQTRVMILKLALHLRRIYKYFFDHLL